MRWIDLRTGYACNNRCRFCDQGDLRDRVADADLATLSRTLVAARVEHGATGVWLAGGEVTTRPDLPALIGAARDAGYARVGLQTNGRILAAAGAAAALRRAGLTDVAVALPAASEPLHAFLTGVPGALRQTICGARRAREAGLHLRFTTVITRSALTELPAIVRLAADLQPEAHRWILAREQGAATIGVLPRLSGVQGPLAEVIRHQQDVRIDVETVGVPLCLLPDRGVVAVDRFDHPSTPRVFPPGLVEPNRPREKPAICSGCALAPVCPGVDLAYLERWGSDELQPQPGPPPAPDPLFLPVIAPCAATCAGCAARVAWAGAWPTEATRLLRQRLIRAAAEQPATLVFAGPSPWSHPALPELVREAVKLRFPQIEVWGPVFPAADLEASAMEKLAGLTRVVVPRFEPEGVDPTAAVRAIARFAAAGIEVVHRDAGPPPGDLYGAVGAAAVWAPCAASPPVRA